ncbi:MAG TPA: polyprenyl synthetase family protein [Chloroflexi bacterium]|nr:polyprenyl synthetase family protein [Chloroflexota bacterium]
MTTVSFLEPVQESLQAVEDLMRQQAAEHHHDLDAALQHLLSAGGKRLRPALVLLTGEMLGADRERLLTLAAAIELLHTATLVHDDLIDGALLRRGIPTLNAHWSPAATVLTGDFMFARAARLAALAGSVEVMQLFAETLAIIVDGEITQLFDGPGLADREAYYGRIYAKTASMFVLATVAPARLSGAGEDAMAAMRRYGHDLGIAYQIVDDILDFTGDQARLGKPVGSDLRHGLITMPTLCYLETHPEDEDLRSILEGEGLPTERMDALIGRIRTSGAIAQAAEDARRFARSAVEALDDMPEGAQRAALAAVADYIVERDF